MYALSKYLHVYRKNNTYVVHIQKMQYNVICLCVGFHKTLQEAMIFSLPEIL